MAKKWLSFGLYSTRKGAKTAARNYGLKKPIVRKKPKKDWLGQTYGFDYKLFDRVK